MGFRNNHYSSFSLFFLVTVTLFFVVNARAGAGLGGGGSSHFCKTADNKELCSAMVKGATTLDQATANAISSSLAVAKHVVSTLDTLKPAVASLLPVTRDSIISTCKSTFEDIVDELTGALKALKAKDKNSVLVKLSASTVTDCADSFDQFGATFPLAKIADNLKNHVFNCAAVANQI
uniref:Pectinesterase inhibitor domain-containing protein n=1 Tax=Davidia involucrata TaxID=16924 RepID=A0A5B7BSJ5_DAVIN